MTQSKDESIINIEELDLSNILDDDTITISTNTLSSDYTFDISEYGVDTIDVSSISTSTITLDDNVTFDWDTINISPTEFEDCMPEVAKVEDMCKDYPALEKAYENFKTIYKMVHQDWQGRQDEDDQLPF